MRRVAAMTSLMVAAATLGGCERLGRNMYDTSRQKPLEANAFFADGGSAQPPVHATVPAARGVIAETSSARLGMGAEEERAAFDAASTWPRPLTRAMLVRGRERFDIYCAPCHSPLGDGDGMVARRGFPAPPSYHQARLRAAPDRHFYDVIANGYGVMPAYGERVPPADRWAIVAYIRALQASQDPARLVQAPSAPSAPSR